MITTLNIPAPSDGDRDEPLVTLPRDEFLRDHIPEWSDGHPETLERWGTMARQETQGRGFEALAWYQSFRTGHKWGIVIRRAGVRGLGHHLQSSTGQSVSRSLKAAFRALYEHELFHFQVDCGYLKLETAGQVSIDSYDPASGSSPYMVSRNIHLPWDHLEEALANLRAVKEAKKEFRPALKSFMSDSPPGYRDFAKFASGPSQRKALDALFNLTETSIDRKPLVTGIGRVIDLRDPVLNGNHVPVYLRLD